MNKINGIKGRLVGSYLFIIIITVLVLQILLGILVNKYYYDSTENSLENQIKVSLEFYNSYLSSSSLKKNVQDNADIFWKNTSAEVQITDESGKILMDSIGNYVSGNIPSKDVQEALTGKPSKVIQVDNNTKEKILSIAYPIKSYDKVEGVLRFITSMKEVDKVISKIMIAFFIISLLVIFIAGVVSLFISNTIVKPIEEVTNVAKKMADGKFNERVRKAREDEIGELSETLNYMADEILKNEKLKNEFIASVSHELRTPLTSIKGWAMTIRTGDLNDKQETLDGIEIIEKECDRLSLLVEELLDFSKLISGKISLKKDYVDIKNTVTYVKKQMEPRASRNNINFIFEIEDNLPIVFADENRIKQVCINLLDNAFKFTVNGGEIILKVKAFEECISITVKDSGIGIPEDEIPKVKEKFFKGKSALSNNGIGLSICDEIMKLHHGTLDIISEVGKGTEVIVKFPICKID